MTYRRVLGCLLLSALSLCAGEPTAREQVLAEMQRRPQDPWPRGTGHVILAVPGSVEAEKAYVEPGGSFSPAVGSFGLSVWALDKKGNVLERSESVPMSVLRQRFVYSRRSPIPGIQTRTALFSTTVARAEQGDWVLQARAMTDEVKRFALVLRSVGPAGGPVTSLTWTDEGRLRINEAWAMRCQPKPARVILGDEREPGWQSLAKTPAHWQDAAGWGFARLEWPADRPFGIILRRDSSGFASRPDQARQLVPRFQPVSILTPDRRFAESLQAQYTHLLMGLVRNETRPGEPTNYPLAWLRDGAYTVVAIARMGNIDRARDLADYFAVHDFFGGFGSEADAPGLALWALGEVARHLNSPDWEQQHWPAVQRKADLILQMLHATSPLRLPYFGPIVPQHAQRKELDLVAEAAKDGLVQGRMDHHRPLLFVNAVSYRGLQEAAWWAHRRGEQEQAQHYHAAALALRTAWAKDLHPPDSDNERTYISALWPTWVGSGQQPELTRLLEDRWQRQRTADGSFVKAPLWTYFDMAEAHQWLYLQRPDRVWPTLRWYWEHQASPGLYTWWEGSGEENNFGRWADVRGWVKPANVTPHYWTAAELLLLQLDMLAYVDEQDVLHIGAGVPAEWLNQPLEVRNLPVPGGTIDWTWRDGRLMVEQRGAIRKYVRGPAFGGSTVTPLMGQF